MIWHRIAQAVFLALAFWLLVAGAAPAEADLFAPFSSQITDTTKIDPCPGGCLCPPPPKRCPVQRTDATADNCVATDTIWTWADSIAAVPNLDGAIMSKSLTVPFGTGALFTTWDHYLDTPRGSGYVQLVEYRFFKNGSWSTWRNASPSGRLLSGRDQYWIQESANLAEAAQADTVQIRYSIQCIPSLAADGANCSVTVSGVFYNNFALYSVTGVPPAPVLGTRPVSLPQSTFVSGTIAGANCTPATVTAGSCWPGIRGSDVGTSAAIHDNVNSPIGDSIVVAIVSPLRTNGMGVNWHFGYQGGGLAISITNASYHASFDVPRVIYRLFDPATKSWSPFDSSALDADAVVLGVSDTSLSGNGFRMVWPPRDKVGTSLPGGFSINGKTMYSQLAFLPRGTRLQYYFKAVDIQGNSVYGFRSDDAPREVEDLPTLPGSSIVAPDILEFDVLPRVYAAGPGGTLLAGKTNTPLLEIDGGYGAWFYGVDPVNQALRALGVRSDRYRLLRGTDYGNNVGGHELSPPVFGPGSNYFPNMDEYAIKDSLAAWYRMVILSGDLRTDEWIGESDAKLLHAWWNEPTGTNGGDRCLFASGNDLFNSLLNPPSGIFGPEGASLATGVLGVAAAAGAWSASTTNTQPLMDDRFSGTGPGLGALGTFTYPTDNGCPVPKRFDGLTKAGAATGVGITFPGSVQAASIVNTQEQDVITDHDRNKALAYAFSLEYIRQGGENLVDPRAKYLYRFVTGCRAARAGSDTSLCWPCPADANMYGNWASLAGFQTSIYGPLYPIQDANKALTGVASGGAAPPVSVLRQNRPNPFNPATSIPYDLARSGKVSIVILDLQGRRVRTLVNEFETAGPHVTSWDGSLEAGGRAASGVYFYRIRFEDGSASQLKMVLLR